ncbi:MAG: hypothetical protein AAFZ91_03710 [Pseudomonadota bacterium]
MKAWIVTGVLGLGACATAVEPMPAQPAPPEMTAPIDLSTPEAAAYSMMRAMYQGDADMVDQVFLEDAILRRVLAEGEVQPDGLEGWRDWVGTLEVGEAHEELFGVTSEQLGTLATVWAPFVITYQGELAGCGVNQLTMARVNGEWRVVFGIDTGEPKETCGDFRARYLGE